MDIFDNLDFLGFVKEKLEKEIKYQEALIENEKLFFYDKQLDYELCKELHNLEKWRDEIKEYIINLKTYRNIENDINHKNYKVLDYSEQVSKLLASNKAIAEKNKELNEEIKILNEEINAILKERR